MITPDKLAELRIKEHLRDHHVLTDEQDTVLFKYLESLEWVAEAAEDMVNAYDLGYDLKAMRDDLQARIAALKGEKEKA